MSEAVDPQISSAPSVPAGPEPTRTAQAHQEAQVHQPESWWLAPLMSLLISGVVVGCALLMYHRLFVRPPLQIGLVDVASIVDGKEMLFTAAMTRATSDIEKGRILAGVGDIEPALKKALSEVRTECQCELLVKPAALSSDNLVDYTRVVALKVGLNDEDLANARNTVRDALTRNGARSPADVLKDASAAK